MAKKKEEVIGTGLYETDETGTTGSANINVISPITQDFGSGDLNILRDKLNEIIKRIF